MHKLPSAQEVFDIVVNHLGTQRRPAYNRNGISGCMYRAPSGLSCAVGALIPDNLYDPEFEGDKADCVIQKLFNKDLADWREHKGLLLALQEVHDECFVISRGTFSIRDLRNRLLAVAEDFSLEYRR
jgi:hypothetical protein